jgi:hypothetical protein
LFDELFVFLLGSFDGFKCTSHCLSLFIS